VSDNSYVGGFHAVKALLKARAADTEQLLVQSGRRDTRMRALIDLAKRHRIAVQEISRRELDSLAGDIEHQGVLARYQGNPPGNEADLFEHLALKPEAQLILILDGLQDPHNFGACLRSADAAGVDAVVVPVDNSVGITPVVRKVASGAVDSLAIFQVTNLHRTMKKLKENGVWIFGAAAEAQKRVFEHDFRGSVGIVMGSEGSGLRRLTSEGCDELFCIPMTGSVESLNVSVATGISLFEVVRQRS